MAEGSQDEIEDWVDEAFEEDEELEISKKDFGNKDAYEIAKKELEELKDKAERTIKGRTVEKVDHKIRARSVRTGRFVRVTEYLRAFAKRIGLID
jgi:hypothetical protein